MAVKEVLNGQIIIVFGSSLNMEKLEFDTNYDKLVTEYDTRVGKGMFAKHNAKVRMKTKLIYGKISN